MNGWVVVAVIVAVVLAEALRRGAGRYPGSVARLVGVWRMAEECSVRFDDNNVGYLHKGNTIETFSYTLIGNRLTIERNCRRTRYRCTFRPDGTLLLASDTQRLTLVR